MDFKGHVKKDVNHVYLNKHEFAGKHEIDGKEIECVIDSDTSQQLAVGNVKNYIMGVYTDLKTIYVRNGDIPTPAIGQRIMLDGSGYFVETVDCDQGMTVITCSGNRQ